VESPDFIGGKQYPALSGGLQNQKKYLSLFCSGGLQNQKKYLLLFYTSLSGGGQNRKK